MTVIVRGFAGRDKRFEETLIDPSPEQVRESAQKHALLVLGNELHMIDLEFPEFPESERFLRFGTDPFGMAVPIPIRF